MDKFVCPGIHQQCIELNGELISPKEFTIRANKDKQKDWKGSIRIGKSNMRALMEMKTLDFYNHDAYCSAKCQSRNYITSKSFAADLVMNQEVYHGASTSNGFDSRESINCSPTIVSNALQQFVAQTVNSPSALASLSLMAKDPLMLSSLLNTNVRPADKKVKIEDGADRGCVSSNTIGKVMQNNPVKFWSLMSDLGILDDILEMIANSVEQTRRLVNINPAQRDLAFSVAERLTRVARALDLEDTIGNRIQAERLQCAIETNFLNSELQAELQRKTEESRRKFEEARQKAARFDELLTDVVAPPKRKRTAAVAEESSAAS
uniref:SAND domain-containing protein n=1 Tax=Syphacia muris TaxID=451379 RepID=A0A0N5AN71_9BILA